MDNAYIKYIQYEELLFGISGVQSRDSDPDLLDTENLENVIEKINNNASDSKILEIKEEYYQNYAIEE